MRFLIIDTYYPKFLNSLYTEDPSLAQESYHSQWQVLINQNFGVSDFYSQNLNRLGHVGRELIVNCRPLQYRWANENGLSIPFRFGWKKKRGISFPWIEWDWAARILRHQIEEFKPEVIYVQDPVMMAGHLLKEIKIPRVLLIAQIASPYPRNLDFGSYHLILSSIPSFVQDFRKKGWRSEYFRLAFEPSILNHLRSEKQNRVAFVGGLSILHRQRVQFLESVARDIRIDWWGYGVDCLDRDSPLRESFHGAAWGLQMYQQIQNSSISLNCHYLPIDEANNMRLYETTGVGTLLLTDHKANLSDMFIPGEELISYQGVSDCIDKIHFLLEHEEMREKIARAGQARTLREHTYYLRMQQLLDLIAAL